MVKKLDQQKVDQIRADYKANPTMTLKDIGERYGVVPQTIFAVVNNKTWTAKNSYRDFIWIRVEDQDHIIKVRANLKDIRTYDFDAFHVNCAVIVGGDIYFTRAEYVWNRNSNKDTRFVRRAALEKCLWTKAKNRISIE